MSELGQTADPKALIPGDPGAVFENVRVLKSRADTVTAVGEALKRIDTGSWTGQASDKFHEDHQTEVPRWLEGSDSLQSAAAAMEDFANTLQWAQSQASEAIARWQQGDATTAQAKTAHDKAITDAEAETKANQQNGDPTVVQPPAFTDPGEAQRQAAREILERARRQLQDAGNSCAETLRLEASLAPQDSQKQSDSNFFGGIWDTISGAGKGLWTLVSDPAETVVAMADNIAHPVDTFKNIVAWDDWASGHGDRALGKMVGGVLLFGAGKAAKDLLGKGEHAGGGRVPDAKPAKVGEERTAAIRDIVTDKSGELRGDHGRSRGVRVVDRSEFDGILNEMRTKLGEPDRVVTTSKGTIETWKISDDPRAYAAFRTYSETGGDTIDINSVKDLEGIRRFHISNEEN
ncbi:putative T7SS-secreted protein [Amycolatopsis saalfeldensis]|uniref:Putative T7SS secretion signal domain-containing protein n=1 Tax=Amycolatopsis saalfeldensis TaxID=394193 RepID=A0A1H8W1B7_9PSEU|nr:hypothetical protein [Amycolatopsis saalfeldensis]SEP21313.1 hypothetical protein SAMN04489732_104460 [Amycolatopsis saalfeldensis]